MTRLTDIRSRCDVWVAIPRELIDWINEHQDLLPRQLKFEPQRLLGVASKYSDPDIADWVERAQEHQRDGEIEIDSEAAVSLSEGNGAYVQAWLWVRGPEETEDD